MTWGSGFGSPWGGSPPIAVGQTLAEIAGLPTTLDLVDVPDGPFPGLWEFYALDVDALGNVDTQIEPSPDTFYTVQDGLGFWRYARAPVIPGPGTPYSERGVAASPSAVLEGRNARVSAILVSPTELLDELKDDELFYEVTIGLRFDTMAYTWVGGRMRARWAAGVWVEPLAVETVQAVGQVATVLTSVVVEPLPDPVDFWRTHPKVEVEVTLRGTMLEVAVGGVWRTAATVPSAGPTKVVLFVRAYRRRSVFITPVPTIAAVQFRSLRDLEKLGPPPQLPGDADMEAIGVLPTLRAPMQQLLDQGYFKQVGARRFEALLDFQAEVDEQRWFIRKGEWLHAREEWVGQPFLPVTRDLARERERGSL